MTAIYTRSSGTHVMTIHAPGPGRLDPAALAAFTTAEPVLGLDVETTAIDDHGPRCFAPAFTVRLVQFGSEHQAWVLDMADTAQRDAAAAVLADPARRFVTHTPFDVLAVWVTLGIPLGQRVADTHLLSKLLDPDERAGHGLKQLSARHLDTGLADAETALHTRMRELAPAGHRAGNAWARWGWNHLPPDDEAYVIYAGLDAIYARRLLPVLLQACGPFAHLTRLDTWLAAQATGITIRGLRLDTGYTRGLLASLQAEHTAASAQITAALGCPGASPKFADWLDAQATAAGITSLPRTPTGRLQVTADTLTTLLDGHADALTGGTAELARARLVMSKAANLIANLRAFLAAADESGRVHPQVNTLRAKTARMSITGPALQTLKKHDPRLRRCFTADPGHVLISCDFSQVEVRVAAALAGDPTLRKVILSGTDIHDATARLMYGEHFTDEQRTISKRATFGTIFGGGAHALASQTGVTDDTARQVISRWRRTYPQVIAYGKRLAGLAEVVTASGRRIPADPARPYANINYAVQSAARDLLLAAVYQLVTRYHVGGLWLFVHDEIIVQAPAHDAERIRGLLEQAMTSSFRGLPIVADAKILGSSWGHTEPGSAPPGQQESGEPRPDTRTPPPFPIAGADSEHDAAHTALLASQTPARGRRHTNPQEVPMTRQQAAQTAPEVRAGKERAALTCAARGWHVLPMHPGSKQPAFPGHTAERCTRADPRCQSGHTGWEPRATTDPGRISRAWAQAPWNVGIATGPSGLLVIDLDKPKPGQAPPPEWDAPDIRDGLDVMAALCLRHNQPWPGDTYTVLTGRNGMHLYFTAPPGIRFGCTTGNSGQGLGWLIDTRGHGGCVAAAGSVTDLPGGGTGRYQVLYDRPPAPLPDWLTALLTAPAANLPLECRPGGAGQVSDLDRYAATALKGEIERVRIAVEPGRNHALNKAAYNLGQLITAGLLPEDQVTTRLYEAASVHFGIGDPPFTPDEARATISSAIAAGKRKPRPLTVPGIAA
jgi:DNA polymerase I